MNITLLNFTAPWCHACKRMQVVLEAVVKEYPVLQITEVSVIDNPRVATRFQVGGLPTLILLSDGDPVRRLTGCFQKDKLMAWLEEYVQ